MSGTREGRLLLRDAFERARRRGASEVTDLDLLAALLDAPDSLAPAVLRELGIGHADLAELEAERTADDRRAGLSAADVAAVAELGIDVDALVARAEEAWGAGALSPQPATRTRHRPRLGPEVRSAMVRGERQRRELRDRYLGGEHLLLGLLAEDSALTAGLRARGLEWTGVRAAVVRARRRGTS
jgi:ATP-dependent Clp protease ATP-binding subunit ClpA